MSTVKSSLIDMLGAIKKPCSKARKGSEVKPLGSNFNYKLDCDACSDFKERTEDMVRSYNSTDFCVHCGDPVVEGHFICGTCEANAKY